MLATAGLGCIHVGKNRECSILAHDHGVFAGVAPQSVTEDINETQDGSGAPGGQLLSWSKVTTLGEGVIYPFCLLYHQLPLYYVSHEDYFFHPSCSSSP